MSTFYDNLALTATRLLRQFGRSVILRRVGSATYNPSTSAAAPLEQNVQVTGALFDYGEGVTEVRGTLVQADDKRLLLEPAALPVIKDRVVVDGAEYGILSVGSVNPAGTPVLFDCHVRR